MRVTGLPGNCRACYVGARVSARAPVSAIPTMSETGENADQTAIQTQDDPTVAELELEDAPAEDTATAEARDDPDEAIPAVEEDTVPSTSELSKFEETKSVDEPDLETRAESAETVALETPPDPDAAPTAGTPTPSQAPIPARTTSLNVLSALNTEKAPAEETKPVNTTKKAKELFTLNKWMIVELEEQEKFAAAKVKDWTRIHQDVVKRLGMARRDQVKLGKLIAGEVPDTPLTAAQSRKIERGTAVFARWPLGGERDLGGGADEPDEDAHWHFGIYLGHDPLSDDLYRIKFLFPYTAKSPVGKGKVEEAGRGQVASQTAYPAQVARLAAYQGASPSPTLVYPGRNLKVSDDEDKYSWIVAVPAGDVVEASWLRPGDRILFFEGINSTAVLREARKGGTKETASTATSSASLFEPASSRPLLVVPMTPEERVVAERPSLAFTPYIVAGPVNAKPRIEEPPKPAVIDAKKGKRGTPPPPPIPAAPMMSPISSVYHSPLTVIPEDRYAEYESALNDMMDPENAAERSIIDAKFLLRGDRTNARNPRPTPFVLGTAVLEESVAATMLARSRGKASKSGLEVVFSSTGLGKWAGAAVTTSSGSRTGGKK